MKNGVNIRDVHPMGNMAIQLTLRRENAGERVIPTYRDGLNTDRNPFLGENASAAWPVRHLPG